MAKLEFKLVHPQSAQLIQQIEAGQGIVPPGYKIELEETERQGKKGFRGGCSSSRART